MSHHAKIKTTWAACTSALVLTGALTAMPTVAQNPATTAKVTFPAELNWEAMPVVTFDFSPWVSGTPAERKLAAKIWRKELDAIPTAEFQGRVKKYPAFILLGASEDGAHRYIFSGLSAASVAYPLCEDPPNGGDEHTSTWANCPMRVVIQNKETGVEHQEQFPDYCLQYSYGSDRPFAENHTEFAFDNKTKTAYFRVLQYGKHVPACDRAIRLQ